MSRITKVWKRHVAPTISDLWLAFQGGVPVPQQVLNAVDYAKARTGGEVASCQVHPLQTAGDISFPARPVFGKLAEAHAVLNRIPCPIQRETYLQKLHGTTNYRGEDFLAVVRHGQVAHEGGIVVTADNRLLRDVSGLDHSMTDPLNPLRRKFLSPPRDIPGQVAVVTCRFHFNYYHWVMEALPRWACHVEQGIGTDWVFAPRKYRYQRETLELLGIPRARILRVTPYRHYRADKLVASSSQLPQVTPAKTDFLFQKLTAKLPRFDESPRRIYISRRRCKWRSVQNEDEVCRALAPLGFRRYHLETMTVPEQISLFHHAECVIAPHGAGLVNLVFCRVGTQVIEIGTPYRPYTCFHEIAHCRRLDYQLYLAQVGTIGHLDPNTGDGDSNMYLECAPFIRHVVQYLNAPQSGRVHRGAGLVGPTEQQRPFCSSSPRRGKITSG
jgi:capsular polysaccharide biosynthesis protein